MTADALAALMKDYCGGWRFCSDSDVEVFNPAMCRNLLDALERTGRVSEDCSGLGFDKVTEAARRLLAWADDDRLRDAVKRAAAGEAVELPCGYLTQAFSLDRPHRPFDSQKVLSLLYCMGFLTFAKGTSCTLRCPNKTMQQRLAACCA